MSTIIMSAICALVCIIPFILMKKAGADKIRLLRKFAEETFRSQSLTAGESEYNSGILMAVDKDLSLLVCCSNQQGTVVSQTVDLRKVGKVVTNVVKRQVNMSGIESIIDKVEMIFESKYGDQQKQTLLLYDSSVRFQLYGELEMAEKWSARLNTLLKENHRTDRPVMV